MGMLDRYRKPGGFAQLLNLLETSAPSKQEKFLALIFDESPAWAEEAKKRMLNFENILTWPIQDLMEFIPRMPEKVVVAALWELPEDVLANVMKSVTPQQRRAIIDSKQGAAPTGAEISTCRNKFVLEARTAGSNGSLKLEKINPDLVIPDGIEAKLRDKFDPMKLAADAAAASGKAAPTSAGSSPTASAKSVNTSNAPATTASISQSEELFNLRKQVLQMEKDLKSVRHENELMKNKLEQIKKIA